METYVCETEGLLCQECECSIGIGDKFAVVSTRSKPYQNNCVPCAEKRLGAEKGASVDSKALVDARAKKRNEELVERNEQIKADADEGEKRRAIKREEEARLEAERLAEETVH